MPNHRQKKLAKHKAKRSIAARKAVGPEPALRINSYCDEIVDALPTMPLGPFYITSGWDDPSTPRLHIIVGTRVHLTDNLYVPVLISVDLGFSGILQAYVLRWHTPLELDEYLKRLGEVFGDRPFVPISPYQATTIVLRAMEYASSFGWELVPEARPGLRVLPSPLDASLVVECGRNGRPVVSRNINDGLDGIPPEIAQMIGPGGFEVDVLSYG